MFPRPLARESLLFHRSLQNGEAAIVAVQLRHGADGNDARRTVGAKGGVGDHRDMGKAQLRQHLQRDPVIERRGPPSAQGLAQQQAS